MAELFKDLYSKKFFNLFTEVLEDVIKDFNQEKFLLEIYDSEWEDLEFSFDLHNHSKKKEKIRLEYGIYYQKQNGPLSKKVFKISEKKYAPQSLRAIIRKQPFKIKSTRKFHTDPHQVSIIINGVEVDVREFELRA